MHESKNYNRTEQLDALLSQMEEMEQELTEKDRETDSLQNQLQEKDQQLQMISSDNQKMKSQIESMNSVLSEQGQLLQKQTEQLEKYSGSDIIFQENGQLKKQMAECQQREQTTREKALMIFTKAEEMKKDAENKFDRAKSLQEDYQKSLAEEVSQAKCRLEKETQRKSYQYLQRKTRQMSGMTVVLLLCYAVQMGFLLFTEREITMTIPRWFRDRLKNILWLVQRIGDFYRGMYEKLTADMPTQYAVGILMVISLLGTGIFLYLSRLGICKLAEKWKQRWQYYDARDMESVKKCAMAGIALMGVTLAFFMEKLSFLPFHWNVVSWWLLLAGSMEILYFHYDEHGV